MHKKEKNSKSNFSSQKEIFYVKPEISFLEDKAKNKLWGPSWTSIHNQNSIHYNRKENSADNGVSNKEFFRNKSEILTQNKKITIQPKSAPILTNAPNVTVTEDVQISFRKTNKENEKKSGREFWGSSLWITIHILALNLDGKNNMQFKLFLVYLSYLLPCERCKKNLKYKLEAYPIDIYLNNNDDAFFYSYFIHDLVNISINKISPPYDEVRKEYISNNKIGEEFWGKYIWATVHILATSLRPENGRIYKKFLECLATLLPGEENKRNFKEKLRQYPCDVYLTNNHDAFFYTYFLHDLFNKDISFKMATTKESPSFDDAKSYYFIALAQECKECK